MVLVYISKRLKEALSIEALFKEAGIEYEVEPDTYVGGIIFRSERTGAFFYVDESNETAARDLLNQSGYKALN
jgi:vacuolar-type H+-ATPase subunit E/Vma4